jgi:hypothetical protein
MDGDTTERSDRCLREGPAVDVTAWRRHRLRDAGFPDRWARMFADEGVDLHELLQLVDRGCPPELAARILSPLGDPGAS